MDEFNGNDSDYLLGVGDFPDMSKTGTMNDNIDSENQVSSPVDHDPEGNYKSPSHVEETAGEYSEVTEAYEDADTEQAENVTEETAGEYSEVTEAYEDADTEQAENVTEETAGEYSEITEPYEDADNEQTENVTEETAGEYSEITEAYEDADNEQTENVTEETAGEYREVTEAYEDADSEQAENVTEETAGDYREVTEAYEDADSEQAENDTEETVEEYNEVTEAYEDADTKQAEIAGDYNTVTEDYEDDDTEQTENALADEEIAGEYNAVTEGYEDADTDEVEYKNYADHDDQFVMEEEFDEKIGSNLVKQGALEEGAISEGEQQEDTAVIQQEDIAEQQDVTVQSQYESHEEEAEMHLQGSNADITEEVNNDGEVLNDGSNMDGESGIMEEITDEREIDTVEEATFEEVYYGDDAAHEEVVEEQHVEAQSDIFEADDANVRSEVLASDQLAENENEDLAQSYEKVGENDGPHTEENSSENIAEMQESAVDLERQATYSDEDNDYEDAVEVEEDEQHHDGEDENVAQHESGSDNEQDEEVAEDDAKLDHISDYDVRDSEDENDDDAGTSKKDGDKPSQEAVTKMFDSDSEDEKKEEGVGDLIADIFGKSDDEDEEFAGFGEEESSSSKKKSLGAIISDSEEDEADDEVIDKAASLKKDDSSSDEGVRDKDKGSEMVYDFDLMLQRKKEERKGRRRRDGGTFINDSDDIINAMLTKMKEAAVADQESNKQKKPALSKLKMLPTVVRHLKKQDLKETFVDMGIIAAIADWLALLPDRSLPHISIREELLRILHDLPSVSPETLKSSGIGRAVMIIFKHPRETRKNKEAAGRLINKWSRPIFGLNDNFKSMSRGEREQRDLDQMPQSKRRKLSSGRSETEKPEEPTPETKQLRPGERGFVMRARVPMPSNKDYVVRPKWNVEDDEDDQRLRKRSKPKKDERLEKHLRSFAERKKRSKMQSAVGISLEGNKMPLS